MASARATVPASATDFTGKGFDACTAPSAATMATWLRLSPYRAVGIYIGGSDRACAQPALTASWVSQQQAAGWHFMPIYVGPQAGFGEINSAASAASQAVSAAQDAVSQARQLGFGPGTLLYYDMEAYPGRLNGRVLRFLTSWTNELHTLGYSSGVYSNSLSGIRALASNYTNAAVTMPDVIYDALWNGTANTLDPVLSSTQWAGHRRVHQYQGGQNVTYGGDTVNIDKDYLDVQQEVTGGSPQASQAAAQSAGDVDAFFKGTDGKLWHDWYAPGSGWHGPVSMGGSLATQPSAVASVPGNVAVFAKGRNGRLLEASYAPGTNWSRLRQLKMGVIGSRPAAVAQANGQIDVFWRGSGDHHLWQAEYRPGKGWSKPQNLGGHLASAPAPAVSGNGALTVAWRGARRPPLGNPRLAPVLGQTGRPGHGQAGQCSRGHRPGERPRDCLLGRELTQRRMAHHLHARLRLEQGHRAERGPVRGPGRGQCARQGSGRFLEGHRRQALVVGQPGKQLAEGGTTGPGEAGRRTIRRWSAQWRDRCVLERCQQ